MKAKYLWLTFGAALFLTVPLRLYQLFFLVDERGFYTDGDLVSYLLGAILFAATAILVIGSFASRCLPKRYSPVRDPVGGILHIGLGGFAIVYSIMEIMRLATPSSESGSSLSGGLLYVAIILAFVGVGAGIVWIVNGVTCLVKKNLLRWMVTAGILPPIWMAILLFTEAVQFSGNAIALNNTESLYDTMALVLMTLFTFNQCKMIAGAQGKKCGKRVYGYGLPMILFGVMASLPAFTAWVTGGVNGSSFGGMMSAIILLLCAAAFVFLLVLPKGDNAFEEELVEEEAEPESEEAPKEEGPKEPLFFRIMRSLLTGITNWKKKRQEKKKRKIIPWEPGELDEKPTKQMDETWRLDFYGFSRDDDKPYYPEIHDMNPDLLEKRQERQEASAAAIAAEEAENAKKSRQKG